MKYKLIPVLGLILLCSCLKLAMWKEGIHQPQQESIESIEKFATKWKKNPDSIYIFKDSTSYFSVVRKKITKKLLLGALVFNEKGLLLNYKDTASCQWSEGKYIGMLTADTTYEVDTNCKYPSILMNLITLDGKPVQDDNKQKYDYTVLYGWANFLGHYNERLFCIDESGRLNKKAKIRIFAVNMDVLKSWNVRNEDMVKLK
jgi:hypothetical protein